MSQPGLKQLIGLILLVGVVLFLGREATTWASSLAKPGRQTVPLTPPATWTPNVPAPPASTQPTRPPSVGRSEVAGPYPMLSLWADQTTLSPGQVIVIAAALTNGGNAPSSEAVVTLTQPSLLRVTRSRTASGDLEFGLSQIIWRPESVLPGETVTLELEMVVSEEASPDHQLAVSGTLNWPEGESFTADIMLTLPWALLPATGL